MAVIEPYKNLHEKSPETKRSVIEAFITKITIYDDGNLHVEIDLSKLYGAEPPVFLTTISRKALNYGYNYRMINLEKPDYNLSFLA